MELKIVKFFNKFGRGTALDFVTDFVTRILYLAFFWTLATIMIFFFAENGRMIAMALTIAASLHFLISEGVFKYLLRKYFMRTRPYIAYPQEIFPIGRKHGDSSFPSSHMSANLSVLTVLVYFYPGVLWFAISFVVLTAFARLHNGMHYPFDIIAGTILGILYGIVGINFAGFIVNILF